MFPETKKSNKTVRILKKPKTEDSERKIFLPKTVALMLVEWKKKQEQEKEVLGEEYMDFNLVLATAYGLPVGEAVILKGLKKLIADNNLPSVVTHSLRHTSIRITKGNAEKMAETGRKRWKIENEGFNRQKNWQGSITHTCSWDDQAQKNHYLMAQISDFMKQLYEYYYLEKNGIKKKQKNISSDLLESFGQQITKEDIFPVDEYTQSYN